MEYPLQHLYDPHAEYAIGVDIGGTKINIGIIDTQGKIVMDTQLPALELSSDTIYRVSQEITRLVRLFREQNAGACVRGIGVGSTGHIDTKKGTVRSGANRASKYQDMSIRDMLEHELHVPVRVDNDVNVLALTEKYFGEGRNVKHMLCIALGTGVGGAMLIEGQLMHGVWGGAGEIGHVSVDFHGPRCVCGANGCLQLYASGTGIARMMNDKLAETGRSEAEAIDSKETIRRWLSDDPLATEVMNEAIAALSTALAGVIHWHNPELIVIGGGVAEVGEQLMDRIREETERKTIPSFYRSVRITSALHGNHAGMIGAAMLHWEQANHYE